MSDPRSALAPAALEASAAGLAGVSAKRVPKKQNGPPKRAVLGEERYCYVMGLSLLGR